MGFYILELMDKTIHEEEYNPVLFDLLNKALFAIKNGADPLLIAVAFQLKFVSFMGYRPQLEGCSLCGRKHSSNWRFSSKKVVYSVKTVILMGQRLLQKSKD